MVEDEYLDEIVYLTEKIQGLTYRAQGFDVNGDLEAAEEWRKHRDDTVEELISTAQELHRPSII